jgi:methyl-accepting chemotaxis protein
LLFADFFIFREGKMSLFKRILAGVVMAVCVIVLVAAVAGIVAVWAINTPTTTALLNVLGAVDNGLVQVETGIGNFNERLGNTQQGLGELAAEIETMGDNVAENSIILTAVEARWGEELAPKVENLRETAQGVRDTVTGIQATIEAVNSIPFVTVPTPEVDKLQQVSDSVAEVRENVQTFRAELADTRANAAEVVVNRLTQPIERVSSGLDRAQAGLSGLDERVNQSLSEIRQLQEQVPVWVDWFSVISTVVLLWLILSQVSLFMHAYRVLRPVTNPTVV